MGILTQDYDSDLPKDPEDVTSAQIADAIRDDGADVGDANLTGGCLQATFDMSNDDD